jgi:hypothetical protein
MRPFWIDLEEPGLFLFLLTQPDRMDLVRLANSSNVTEAFQPFGVGEA